MVRCGIWQGNALWGSLFAATNPAAPARWSRRISEKIWLMGILSWLVVGLIAGFIASKVVMRTSIEF